MREVDLDPGVEAAFTRVTAAANRLASARIRSERTEPSYFDEPVDVDNNTMNTVASSATASDEMRRYAARVADGECQWSEIEQRSFPLPREVAELKNSPHFVWRWSPTGWQQPFEDEEEDVVPYRIPWE